MVLVVREDGGRGEVEVSEGAGFGGGWRVFSPAERVPELLPGRGWGEVWRGVGGVLR